MPRPRQHRKIVSPPLMMGYKPFGIPARQLDKVVLNYDEYEAIRLLDYEGLTQEQAGVRMHVSRPTLTRIYERARQAIAKAFVEGKMIVIEGGNVEFEKEWFRCRHCYQLVGSKEDRVRCEKCGEADKNQFTPIVNTTK